MKMNKRLASLCLVLLLCLTTIGLTVSVVPKTASAAITVSQLATNLGKTYLQVDGKPYMNIGIQNTGTSATKGDGSAFPTPMPVSYLENFFEKTKAANFTTIQQQLKWNDFEPTTQGVYDFSLVDKYIDWANQYGLKIDWVFFGAMGEDGGTRLPGHTNGFVYCVPDYIANTTYFPHGDGNNEIFEPDLTGTTADFIFSNEYNAVKALFNHIATYDTSHRTILFQVNNEPNLIATWNSNRSDVLARLNKLGEAVKTSNYVVATRVNFAGTTVYKDVNDLSNIDFVGGDPYTTSVSTIASMINSGNSDMPYIAENAGNYGNISSLVATAVVNGGFYDVWQLADNWPYFPTPYYSTAVHYTNWTVGTIPPLNPGAQRLSRLNAAMNKIYWAISQAPKGNFGGFNINTDNPVSNYSGTNQAGPYQIGFASTDTGIGIAVNSGSYVYVVGDTGVSNTFKTYTAPIAVTVGYQDSNGSWVNQGSRSFTNNGDGSFSITYNSQEALRIELPASANLALNKTATASSTGAAGQEPGKAVDGSTGTKWSSQLAETSWLQVDLGQAYNVNRYVVKHAGPYESWGTQSLNTRDFQFQVSTDATNWTTLDTVTGNTSNVTDHNVTTSNSYRYVRLYITNPQTETTYRGARIYEFEVYGSSNSNKALNKTATASSTGAAGQEPGKAVDGSTGTKWSSQLGETSWLQVDLGQAYNVNRYVAKHAGPYESWGTQSLNTRDFQFQVSTDAVNWTTLDTVTGNTSNVTDHNVTTSNSYRYVRLYITNPQTETTYRGARIYEFEVYGN